MKTIPVIAAVAWLVSGVGCWAGEYESPFDQYFERTDTITLSAGNAKEVNATIHTIDPWPRRVGNRRIPANGARMIGAIQRYRSNQPAQANMPTGQPGATTTGGAFNASTTSTNQSQSQ
jgi:hypothetical protein